MMPKKVVSGNKIKIEVEIPKVYYEGLFANPSVDMDLVMEKIEQAVLDSLSKSYKNQRILPAAVRTYLEAKYGDPNAAQEMDAQTAQIMDEESVEEKADDNTNYGILS
jgi:hypothetical protein